MLRNRSGYRVFQDIVGSKKAIRTVIDAYIGNTRELSLIDIGAGDSDVLQFINPISYVAIELNVSYADATVSKFGNRVTSVRLGINDPKLKELNFRADLILILGVLHHLEDDLVTACLSSASRWLKDHNSRVFIVEPVLTTAQNPIARLLIKNDRGNNVRSREGYEELIKPVFNSLSSDLRTDLLRIPYTHFICTAQP